MWNCTHVSEERIRAELKERGQIQQTKSATEGGGKGIRERAVLAMSTR